MRKYKKVALWVLILSILYMAGFALYKTYMGESIRAPYFRFQKDQKANTTINWWSSLFPIQIESQKTLTDTTDFKHRVVYPIAPKFLVTEPSDKKADTTIANEIAKVVKDSMESIQYSLWGDIDRQAVAVRNFTQPKTLSVFDTRKLSLSLEGTASPEAEINGFKESIQPGHFERENKILASNRLSRTKNILLRKLAEDSIVPSNIQLHAVEIQLNQTQLQSVMNGDHSVLDSLRYVEAHIHIMAQHVVVTPITAPVLLPLWIIGIGLLSLSLSRKKVAVESEKETERETSYRHIEPIDLPKKKKRGFWAWLYLWLKMIGCCIHRNMSKLWYGIIAEIIALWSWIKKWWPRRPLCQFLVIWFLISAVFILYLLISWLFFGLHFCFN